jgi:hypothetical protein
LTGSTFTAAPLHRGATLPPCSMRWTAASGRARKSRQPSARRRARQRRKRCGSSRPRQPSAPPGQRPTTTEVIRGSPGAILCCRRALISGACWTGCSGRWPCRCRTRPKAIDGPRPRSRQHWHGGGRRVARWRPVESRRVEGPEWYRVYHPEAWDEPDGQEQAMIDGCPSMRPWPAELHDHHSRRRWQEAKYALPSAAPGPGRAGT